MVTDSMMSVANMSLIDAKIQHYTNNLYDL